jgi:hypothetical protein
MAKKPTEPVQNIERFEVKTIHRSKIHNAPYNPRFITDEAKRKLKGSIKRNGLLAPPTWNIRTGNIVGGHQRISVMDDLHGTQDYELQVAVVDLDDKQEKAANIALNNPKAQGDFIPAKLAELLQTPDLDFTAAGYENVDVFRLLGNDPNVMSAEDFLHAEKELEGYNGRIKKLQQTRDGREFYIVFVFPTDERATNFLVQSGLDPEQRYQPGFWIEQKLNIPVEDDDT